MEEEKVKKVRSDAVGFNKLINGILYATEVFLMDKWKCNVCGWVYDPEIGDEVGGIAPGTPFESLPDTWTCPVCGAPKDTFEKVV